MPEFRAEAVRLVRERGRPVRQIAEELGASTESLHNWTKRRELDEGRRGAGRLALAPKRFDLSVAGPFRK